MNAERTITKDKGPPDKTTPNIYPNELMKLHEENLNKNKIIASGKDEGMGNGGGDKRWGDKWQDSSGQWCWDEELHGDEPRISLPTLKVAHGETQQYGRWTFHDGFCGIGGGTIGFGHAGGKCMGAFDSCARARAVYQGHTGREPGRKWEELLQAQSADVYYGAAPCEDKEGLENQKRLIWQQLELVRQHQYKVIVIETVLHFKRMHNGEIFRAFIGDAQEAGYVMHCKLLFSPDFGSAAARRRIMLVGIRRDVHEKTGDFRYPTKHDDIPYHPLSSILESNPILRKPVLVGNRNYTPLPQPKQVGGRSLRQIGKLSGQGPGRNVYCPSAFASTQTASGMGPGWTSGLYLIHGTVSRLLVSEVQALMQIEKDIKMDPVESVARRHLGNAAPVGMMRAMGISIEQLLLKHRDASRSEGISATATEEDMISPAPAAPRKAEAVGVLIKRYTANHEAKMVAWQAASAARAAVAMAAGVSACPRWWELNNDTHDKLRRGVRFLSRQRWLKIQRQTGEREATRMEEEGVDMATVLLARATIRQALKLEWYRGDTEDGPINLIWWNWSGPIPRELIHGVDIGVIQDPDRTFPDNYETANCQKVWDEFTRMNARSYLLGPYEDTEGIHMTHPIGAVAKKGSNKMRIVIDMSITLLNDNTQPPRFPLPTVEDAVDKAYPGCWMMTADLVDGFYGVAVRKQDQRMFGLKHPKTGKFYKFARLPMGFRPSPFFFCRLVAWAVREAQKYPEFKVADVRINDKDKFMPRIYGVDKEGMPVVTTTFFVDDSLIIAPTRERCVAAYDRLVWLLESRLGWRICTRKTKGPAQRIEFLGLEMDSVGLDTKGPCTRLSKERRDECLDILTEFIQKSVPRRKANRREMATLVGKLSFCANAIPAGRCFLARCYRAMHETDEIKTGRAHDYDRPIALTTPAILDLRWWQEALRVAPCVRYWKTRTFALHRFWSDASNYGLAESMATEAQGELPSMAFTHGVWPEALAGFSSNYHELATIVHSIKLRGKEIAGSVVQYHTDNTTAVKAVNTGCVRSPELSKLARELKRLQAMWDIEIEALHLSGVLIQKQGSDGASRSCPWLGMFGGEGASHDCFSPMEWPRFELDTEMREAVAKVVGSETIDMSEPRHWYDSECAGKDTYWHLRPCHVTHAMEVAMDAALREPDTTSFTMVIPRVGMRKWRRYFKHFRHKKVYAMQVEGLGEVHHWILRYEPGDGRRPREGVMGEKKDKEEEAEEEEWE